MQIIPVLDIKDGLVVRGIGGRRDAYRPIRTPLSASPEPVAVARGLDALAGAGGFPDFYVADLDAIEGGGTNSAALLALEAAFPSKRFWVDAGIRCAREARAHLARPGRVAVLGTESMRNAKTMRALAGEGRSALSLDFRGNAPLGPASLFRDPSLWPARVIVMTLARVGSGAGPDLDRLAEVKAMAAGRAVYAAGGVRDADDIEALARLGVSGALVSTALHDGRLKLEAAGEA